ncbi:hypothetical protein [Nocardioides sp. B-3]|uniref:hypothetical protein n=1 Tax=Nocardioides sp. B-3 TaxID=2895565 RepID=UPI0021520171|nr:hypothetical protein [Nocardioides sp. B-3]UUZ58751.1 hypothetical protein LP418_22020 [Nocardioides sp. B-3]
MGGDLKLATFNVLNYFTTLGSEVPGCSAFVDRDNNPIATRGCSGPNGPRGARDRVNFERQQAKIVRAINTMDADIVSLEELENSRTVDGGDRDEAIAALVAALNADAGRERWAYVASPAAPPRPRTSSAADSSTTRPRSRPSVRARSSTCRRSTTLVSPWPSCSRARAGPTARSSRSSPTTSSPRDQVSTTAPAGATPTPIASPGRRHWSRSPMLSPPSAGPNGCSSPVTSMPTPRRTRSREIEAAGYVSLKSTDNPDEESYSFAGTSGSLDHVFANAAAQEMVTGVDLWEINANESVFYQYSRFNYVGTDLYRANVFASSDHNPEVVGIKLPAGGIDRDCRSRCTPQQ